MGRDVAGLHIDKKSSAANIKSNGSAHGASYVSSKDAPDSVGTKDCDPAENTSEEKQDDLGAPNANHELQGKILRSEAESSADTKLFSLVKCAPSSPINEANSVNSSGSLAPGVEGETSDDGVKCSTKSNDTHSSGAIKKSQTNFSSRKQLLPGDSKYYDDDDDNDNLSLASSTATSQTNRSRVTVPVAPLFVCTDRAERRKEFYDKLEEKHKALEQEKLEYEARTKEEELATIKQLRKSMTYKANPIPSFYREGPPPKTQLKKVPVTRAKSPNLTRRKSCGDAVKSTPGEKGLCGQSPRHSVGIYNEGKNSPVPPKCNSRSGVRKSNGSGKAKDPRKPKETAENSLVKELGNADVSVSS